MKTVARQNNFNLVRIVLALLVLLSHSPELVDGDRHREILTMVFGSVSFGEFAVDGFFLLSGYLIAQSWVSNPNAWAFLKSRLLRIYPGFVVSFLICTLIVGPLGSNPIEYFHTFWVGSFMKGILFLSPPVVADVFRGQPHASLNGSMWTISYEFLCYGVVLTAGVVGLFRVRHLWLTMTAAVFAAFAMLKLSNLHVVPGVRLFCFFLCGTCYCLYRDQIKFKGWVAAACFALTVIALFSVPVAELGLASVGGYALLYMASRRSELLSHFNRLPDVSYGVYLYGWPLQKLLLWHFPGLSPWVLFALSAPASIVAGMISWYLIEKPALRFKGPSINFGETTGQTISS